MSGGAISGFFEIFSGSEVNFSGGLINGFGIDGGVTINISGTSFTLNGNPITGLALNTPFTVIDRNAAVLAGTLADNTSFDMTLEQDLFDAANNGTDWISSAATINIILVPEPASLALLSLAVFSLLTRRKD
ncbi:PEP-CTERM sorting domain-containing protein [Poriferisphaera sp. WC338]|uniref:PEP-CTERM sorting domain-containing protein n=1 Tax=Poriferisphaera sp. WC338 TaxID=3425129 RepID=UPI003D815B94